MIRASEKVLERLRRYRERYAAAKAAGTLKPRKPSSAKDRERARKWYLENKERKSRYDAELYLKDPIAFKERTSKWAADNRDKVRVISHNRRARYASAEGVHTLEDDQAIRKLQKDRCAYCRSRLRGEGHLDHIIALARGGSNWPKNLQWLCPSCNSSKNAKDPIVFAQGRGMLI